jgi:hypothetical protein
MHHAVCMGAQVSGFRNAVKGLVVTERCCEPQALQVAKEHTYMHGQLASNTTRMSSGTTESSGAA